MAEINANFAGGNEYSKRKSNSKFARGLARACGGAIIFSLPMQMTMELWSLGFYLDPGRLALLLFFNIPLLIGLSHFSGFERTFDWKEDTIDAFVAFAVGFLVAAVVLSLFAVIGPAMKADEILGKIALQAIPGSMGALLAHSQFVGNGEDREQEEKRKTTYFGELFLMAAGALFLAFNVAPTEEMVLIAYKMTEWHALALASVSLILMHAFVYAVEFSGQADIPPDTPFWSVFLRFTVTGYAVALLISLYVLWTFERTIGMSLIETAMTTVVLGFPAAIGAAATRLIL